MPEVVVVGAGVFGAWTARHLQRAGRTVALIDAHGAGNARASSGGETRIIRMGYGPDEIYSRWARRSLEQWQALSEETEAPLFVPTGVLWLGHEQDPLTEATAATLARLGERCERLTREALAGRYPQLAPGAAAWGLLEADAGVLMARRAVRTLVRRLSADGAACLLDRVERPAARGPRLTHVTLRACGRLDADQFVFACGPWLPQVFPDLLGDRIHPTRQEVFFFGPPAGDPRFAPPALPAWIDFRHGLYGTADLEARGVKIAIDTHGPPFDPEAGERLVAPASAARARDLLAARFPALAGAPLLESRVCQYENTSSGDFLIDRHPAFDNVWLVGGGSGHGFKHGPLVGEQAAALVAGTAAPEPRFSLATKDTTRARVVF